jgi:gamma-glutamyl:cysteine ligase YbdK (ATP-grasp superfamily)
MTTSDLARAVTSLTVSREAFRGRVEAEAEMLKDELRRGTFDNPGATVGLEHELYAVDADATVLRRVPRRVLDRHAVETELGIHNAELHTSPQPLSAYGLRAQLAELRARLAAALATADDQGVRLVSDGTWTVPPAGESARSYLSDAVERDGVTLAANVSDDPRYHAFANADGYDPGCRVETPNAAFSTDVVTSGSLTASIQPHYQVPRAADLPERFRYALRVAAPLLALGANSPVFPPGLYDTDDPEAVLAEGWAESRVPTFEGVFNPRDAPEKARFPREFDSVAAAVDRLVADHAAVPADPPERGRFDDTFRHLRHKHGSFWRWVRPVFDGATREAASARIEFRPVPAQPTARDAVAFQAAFAGLMESLPARDHPVRDLDWATARDNFYAAARDGLDADVQWITASGDETRHLDAVLDEVLALAHEGLERAGMSAAEAEEFLAPLRARADAGVTPAAWKRAEVRRRVADGATLADAIEGMQAAYVDRQAETLLDGSFADWLAARSDESRETLADAA